MKKVIIDRKTWKRGRKGEGASLLQNSEGYKCCLGFLGEACGVDDIMHMSYPSETDDHHLWPNALFELVTRNGKRETLEEHLAKLNDNPKRSYAVREARIKREFKKMGFEVEFIN